MEQLETASDWEDWFERVWAYREDVLYPSLFGQSSRGIFPVPGDMITGMFKQETFDARWLHYGVFEFAPTDTRGSWLYVTSGMSNDWEADVPDPATESGLGCEFVLETNEQAEWPIVRLLHLMVFQLLICHGRYPGREPLNRFDRIPLRASIGKEPSLLTLLMLAPPLHFSANAELESGPFEFLQVAGISEAEAAYSRSNDGESLLKLLIAERYFPVIDPDREELALGTG